MTPKTITVHLSHSPIFPNQDQVFPFAEFEQLALLAARTAGDDSQLVAVTVSFDTDTDVYCAFALGMDRYLGYQDFITTIRADEESMASLKPSHQLAINRITFPLH